MNLLKVHLKIAATLKICRFKVIQYNYFSLREKMSLFTCRQVVSRSNVSILGIDANSVVPAVWLDVFQ